MPLATDGIDIRLVSLPNDLPPLRCVSSSMELDGYGVSSVSQLAVAGCSVGGRVGGGGRAWDIGLLGRRGCGAFCASPRRGSVTGWGRQGGAEKKRGQSAGCAPFAALDRPFALRPLLQASRSGFLGQTGETCLGKTKGASLSTAEQCEPLGGSSEPNVKEWSREANNGNDEVFCAADGDK